MAQGPADDRQPRVRAELLGRLHWRGPREFTCDAVLGPGDLGGEATRGRQAPWLAFAGEHDAVDAHSALVFAHASTRPHRAPLVALDRARAAATAPSRREGSVRTRGPPAPTASASEAVALSRAAGCCRAGRPAR
ncbi:DUF6807 family protein [Salinifilum ghardaiensis]